MNFNDILREKMKTETASAPSEKSYVTGLDPAHLAYLMGQTERLSTVSPRGNYKVSPVKPQRKPHVLSDLQREALAFLSLYTPSLNDTFTAIELKKAFRQAALRLHPDQGGTNEAYTKARQSFQQLSLVFTAK